MGFNYGLEKRKFTEEWKKLYREYKAAGMSEEDIQDIYASDLNVFRKNRTEFQRTQPLSESSCDDGIYVCPIKKVLQRAFCVRQVFFPK